MRILAVLLLAMAMVGRPPAMPGQATTPPQQPAEHPSLEDSAWKVTLWQKTAEPDPDPKKNAYREFKLGKGTDCTYPGRNHCEWKLDGDRFTMTVPESKHALRGEFDGTVRGKTIEGKVSYYQGNDLKSTSSFRAEVE